MNTQNLHIWNLGVVPVFYNRFQQFFYLDSGCRFYKITLNYLNSGLNIGLVDWRNVYFLSPELIKLQPEVYKGMLIYRKKGSSKRIS
jgi:hypothetical protein